MQERAKLIQDNIGKVIIGKEDVIKHILTAMIAGGHVLLEDVPGTGKTRMARALAASMGLSFGRIQFTPDMLPADVTGLHIYNRQTNAFELKKGPVFTNILLADEINRATPRTQSGLLECMEERQVTIDGETQKLNEPFFVIATQNPIETAGTFPLPEAQMDRFFMKLSMGLPERDEEVRILETYREADPLKELTSVVSCDELMEMKKEADKVYVHPLIEGYLVDIVRATRDSSKTLMGVSPRGTIAFLRAARTWAWLHGSSYVRPDDVKAVAPAVLAHRLVLAYGQNRYQDAVRMIHDICESVPAPTESVERR
ncbi:MAG: MoxR family ATPase [Lachnospiraceae bacterium]|nr:MoxR family ATPase [Lachnospiraceae bacterium]